MEGPGTRGGFPGAFPFLDAAHLIPRKTPQCGFVWVEVFGFYGELPGGC
ncbi:hypothetical protein HMPREF0742_02698 [Rothia aeria F0184]|uniref:Uncharacterized protein n=1 Tax=Rothia aeria F0184 TaxID=888019 RepID=U7UW74_9MICC|nr:hypothetical protein HMPREF0742_02698 [Rothia aeria F0184]